MKPLLALSLFALSLLAHAENADDRLGPWREGVKVAPVLPPTARHTVHTYFNVCPESPDGKRVLFYSSTARDAQRGGAIHFVDRASGEEKVLVKNLTTEDAHRVACQQWISGGKRVVYHDDRNGEWIVAVVDVETGTERILAKNRLTCWGQPGGDIIPIYGMHWNPGAHRDLELLNVESGEITTVVTNDEVRKAYPQWIFQKFGEKPTSIFFPILSPDSKRIFFKMAGNLGGDPRSKGASDRQGLICFGLEEKKLLFKSDKWGHPAWMPDSKNIVEAQNELIDSASGKVQVMPELPNFGSGHPSSSPDGKLIVTDTTLQRFGGTKDDWGIVVMDVRGTHHTIIHRFNNSQGARSWRSSHPHPVFSPDGKRIYFNISSGEWTQLHVAECGPGAK